MPPDGLLLPEGPDELLDALGDGRDGVDMSGWGIGVMGAQPSRVSAAAVLTRWPTRRTEVRANRAQVCKLVFMDFLRARPLQAVAWTLDGVA